MTPPGSAAAPEAQARLAIDARLVAAGRVIQDRNTATLGAGRGEAIREFRLVPPHGFADYLLFVDGQACGVLEAKAWGHTLSGVEPQADRYAQGRQGQRPLLRPQARPQRPVDAHPLGLRSPHRQNFTLNTKRVASPGLDDFVTPYLPTNRHERAATWSESTPDGGWRPCSLGDLLTREEVRLDLRSALDAIADFLR